MEKEIKNRWWVRLFKVLNVIWLIIVTISIFFVVQDDYYFDSYFSHGTLLKIGGYTLIAYILTEVLRRIFIYIGTGKSFFSINTGLFQKILFIISILTVLIGLVLIPIDKHKQKVQEDTWKVEQKTKYELALSGIGFLRENLRQCSAPIIEKKVAEKVRACNLYKGKVKNDYDFCVSLSSINSPTSCLYENDYQKIDCSEETQKDIVLSSISRYDLSNSCALVYDQVVETNNLIDGYKPD